MSKKKILITGTAGFIGFHLAERMLNENWEVVGYDNINNYYDVKLKYARLREAGIDRDAIEYGKLVQSSIYPNYRFIKANLEDCSLMENLFQKEQFDVVCNLAAQAGVRYSIENPRVYVQSNLVGFVNILECCRHNQIKHLVYASSSSVYGNSDKVPFSEDDRVDYPVSLYAATKKANELMAHTYSHLYQLSTTGLRFFTVYGPWGRPDMAPMLFAKAIAEGKPIKVFNNGDMMRDFTYITDIIEGIVRVIEAIPGKGGEHPYYQIFNIGCSNPVRLMDFIVMMEKAMRKKAVLEMCPMQKGDVKRTFADSNNIYTKMNYLPSFSLKNGIEEFTNWYITYEDNVKRTFGNFN
ncbi:UDP-glucuronate 4-epimerase [Parabacteroides sp. PF5-5]|uniref:NAD-dependent epimerase/dehydratase family protein n=1 Tax=unclassified Parabacteroides TaxID=2649774 RepID=UPI002473F98B|nr:MULTISPECIES: NAD-dependent epimerase/dehydratase family protein [unclassified Parabacteroides]MDH6316376.1 UDP-glucuronate 4-epimerase [Parabacteroides sp. PF5-13]MDH6327563.1 UDP-glucuronate 4-epimerase [Parabacteroides sp. PH5-41]MDH6335297.1 UDP-glucuronate 4-epimerase [Parabacteroides sp. PF5-5]MDH6346360.1 UDP-glucuronate 4-epimerase [Parabacteroides sp. PH5-46]MDH6361389.1 UDP-glucuronate 4-epimerase [Parabacteroides sp. PH5-16]